MISIDTGAAWPVAYARFSKGGGGRNFDNEDQKKISPLRISPFFGPKLGVDQKKEVFTQY